MKIINNIFEFAIEFAWQIGDKNTNITRAESRWVVLNEIIGFLESNPNLPDEDIDEFVENYLSKNKKLKEQKQENDNNYTEKKL